MDARPASVGTLAAQLKGFELVRGVLTSSPLFILVDVPFGLLFTAVILLIGGKLALVPLLAIPVCLFAGLAFQRAIQRGAREHQQYNNSKTGLLVEAIDGAESLKANSADWKIQARWNLLVEQVGEAEYRTRRFSNLSMQTTQALQQAAYVSMIAFGAYLVVDNQLTQGALIGCAIIANRALSPILQLPGVMVQWAHARAALDGLDHIIGLPNETDADAPALVPQSVAGELRFDRCRFIYAPQAPAALELQRFLLKPGEKVCVIGSVGAGKSTLLKLASGLYRPAQGKIFLDGIDMATIAPAFLRENIAYLPQEPRLFSGTLRDNLLIGLPDPGDEAILQAARRTGLFDLIAGQPKGLALPIAEGGRGISGGQRQQVALTRLVLARPRVWLMDEPSAAMDAGSEQKVIALLREAAADGASLLVSTHKTSLLPIFDRVVVLHAGRLVYDGPREEAMARMQARGQAQQAAMAKTSE
jgi:ATP-binding cassette subfamily C protein LapB